MSIPSVQSIDPKSTIVHPFTTDLQLFTDENGNHRLAVKFFVSIRLLAMNRLGQTCSVDAEYFKIDRHVCISTENDWCRYGT